MSSGVTASRVRKAQEGSPITYREVTRNDQPTILIDLVGPAADTYAGRIYLGSQGRWMVEPSQFTQEHMYEGRFDDLPQAKAYVEKCLKGAVVQTTEQEVGKAVKQERKPKPAPKPEKNEPTVRELREAQGVPADVLDNIDAAEVFLTQTNPQRPGQTQQDRIKEVDAIIAQGKTPTHTADGYPWGAAREASQADLEGAQSEKPKRQRRGGAHDPQASLAKQEAAASAVYGDQSKAPGKQRQQRMKSSGAVNEASARAQKQADQAAAPQTAAERKAALSVHADRTCAGCGKVEANQSVHQVYAKGWRGGKPGGWDAPQCGDCRAKV